MFIHKLISSIKLSSELQFVLMILATPPHQTIPENTKATKSYRLSRQNLEKLYLVYIRPIFEYACEICDNCGVCYSPKLEKLHLDAARIVTG